MKYKVFYVIQLVSGYYLERPQGTIILGNKATSSIISASKWTENLKDQALDTAIDVGGKLMKVTMMIEEAE